MALAIDGSVHNFTLAGTSVNGALTTTQANDYIIVCAESNGAPVTGVSGSTLGAFTHIQSAGRGGVQFTQELWAVFSAGILSAETITVTQQDSQYLAFDAFGVSGSGQSSLVWDAGGPQIGVGSPADPISITTVNAITMVIGTFAVNTPSPTAGAGLTAVSGADYLLTEYKVLSSAATTSVSIGTGVGLSNGSVVVAIVGIAAGGASPVYGWEALGAQVVYIKAPKAIGGSPQ